MAMIKKCLIILSLILIIVSQIGVCYADTDNRSYLYNSNNSNIYDVNNLVGNRVITDYDRQQLLDANYKNVLSRYSTPTCHISITDINIRVSFLYNTTNSNYSDSAYDYFISYLNNYSHYVNLTNVSNADTSNLQQVYTFGRGSNYFYINCYLLGSISFDISLSNDLLNDGDFNNVVDRMHPFGFNINWTNSYFSNGGYTYQCFRSSVSSSNVSEFIISYQFENQFNNVDAFIIQCQGGVNCGDSSYKYNTQNRVQYICGGYTTEQVTDDSISGNLFACMFQPMLNDSSQVANVSMKVHKQGMIGGDYFYTFNSSYDINLTLSFYTPIFFNNNQYFIQSGDNVTTTPLKLQYYDAKWYELHLQIANAFIFMITELPIVSDVTNLIYSIVNLIYNSLSTLTSFNGFGILFAFGMFAIVLGIFLKIIIGSD